MGETPLVMTSGNRSDEPIACDDLDAVKRLAGIADLFLAHNRPIHVRCDDSITRCASGKELPVRRSRGYAPQPISLPTKCAVPMLAVGGQLKGTFALGRDHQAFLSHHLGDLDHFDAYQAFVKDVALFEDLFAIRPRVIAHDLHPDYATTRYARQRSEGQTKSGASLQDGAQLLAVQHHHAHMASCMAEHGLTAPVIGVTFDGTGFGTDGAIWGGEFLVGDLQQFRRAAHLRYVGMAGGEQAIREPWRMALAHLVDCEAPDDLLRKRIPTVALAAVRRMLERGFNAPLTSSAGRLFDAVAALAGVRDIVSYEGQAAMELEWRAMSALADVAYPFDLAETVEGEPAQSTLMVDPRPIIRAVAHEASLGTDGALIARRFHSTMVELIAAVCDRLRSETGVAAVVLSGGVFMNGLLSREVSEHLKRLGFVVYGHQVVPPNDGGLSLGQLAIAAQRTNLPPERHGSCQAAYRGDAHVPRNSWEGR
jgi:hydrogenase maturation protein HypF